MSEEKGYEVLDAKAVCDDEYMEDQERQMRVQGFGMNAVQGYGMDADDKIKGFIKRNNVRERM